MSNNILYLIILSITLFFAPIFHFIAKSINLSALLFIDNISGLLVFLLPIFFYLSATNNKTYLNKEALSLKLNYLKEIFLLLAFTGTNIGLMAIWAGGQRNVEFSGEMWMELGAALGVALLSDLYGVLGFFSTSITENILVRRLELENKITTKYKSNTYLSIGFLIIPMLIFILIIQIAFEHSGMSVFSYFNKFAYILISICIVLIIITVLIFGNNIKIVFKSIFNKPLDKIQINAATNSIKALCRILLIICGVLFLSSLVLTSFTFGFDSFFIALSTNFSIVSCCFSLILIYVLILRTFLLKLNLELVELNHITIDSDKYFIFKYCIPLYISIHIGSGFAFLIMIFK